jgi:hypothetical protein
MQLINLNTKTVQFDGRWYNLIGNPALNGSWIIWGQSSNGKSHFLLQLCKYLTNFGRAALVPLEEGIGESLKRAIIQENMDEVNGKLIIVDDPTIEDLIIRLKKKKSPRIIAIDSLQYSGITYQQYKDINKMFPSKLFIWNSHADGRNPAGRIAQKIRYDASVKIHIEGYQATAQSRYGENPEPYVIWQHGYERYWGVNS